LVLHKFNIGDRVTLITEKFGGDIAPGVYKISRRLPIEGNVCHYRVKHVQDGHERAVRENQLVNAG